MESDPKEAEAASIECSRCGCAHWFVLRVEHKPSRIVRRRECRHCGKRVTTVERVRDKDDG